MNITLRQMDAQSLHQVDQFQRNSIVYSHLVLQVQDNRISYSIRPVEPYEKILNVDPEDYATFIDNPQKVIFFADVDGKPVGQIKMVPWWNKFTYIEELTVDTDWRCKGVGRALLTRAMEWAKAQGFPGVTLETQDNNVQKHDIRLDLRYLRCQVAGTLKRYPTGGTLCSMLLDTC